MPLSRHFCFGSLILNIFSYPLTNGAVKKPEFFYSPIFIVFLFFFRFRGFGILRGTEREVGSALLRDQL